MTDRLASPVELDQLVGGDEVQQTAFWARYKARFGAEPRAFRIQGGGHFLVLLRRLAPALYLGYVPYGPECPAPPVEGVADLLTGLAREARESLPRGTAFLRFDLPWSRGPRPVDSTPAVRFVDMEIQPAHTVILDLGLEDRRLLADMHAKTRYNIGLAERRGVTVRPGRLPEDLDAWYDIKVENDRRDGIVTHSRGYFRALMESGGAPAAPGEPRIELLCAWREGRLLGGVIVCVCGRAARYLHGASGGADRNTMFSYALQWAALRWARERGAASYDLYGIPPDDDPAHPMHGLYRFKTGFGGAIVHRMGCHDVVLNRAVYAALRLPERARYVWYKQIRRRLRRRPASAPSP